MQMKFLDNLLFLAIKSIKTGKISVKVYLRSSQNFFYQNELLFLLQIMIF